MGDDKKAAAVPLTRLTLTGQAGLLLRRPMAVRTRESEQDIQLPMVSSDRTDLEFIPVSRSDLARTAVELRRSWLGKQAVVICPPGVSPGRTALALAVAETLSTSRTGNGAVVTCATVPPPGQGRSAIPHEVWVSAGSEVQERHVWEIVAWSDLTQWLERHRGPRR